MLALALTALLSGYVIDQKIIQASGPNAQTENATMAWEGVKMRSDFLPTEGGPPGITTLVDFGSDKMTMINHERKEYSEIELVKFVAQMNQQMEMMKKQLEQLPPEQKKKKMMGAMFEDLPVTFVASKETQKISGLNTTKYVVTRGGKDVGEVWLTKEVDLGELGGHLEKLSKSMQSAMGGMGGSMAMAFPEGMTKGKGYPVKTVSSKEMMGQKVTTTSEITKIERQAVPAEKFKVPAGYKKVDMSQMNQMPTSPPPGQQPPGVQP